MRGFWKLTLVQTKLFLREPAAFFFTLVFPTLLLLMFGAIFGNEPDPEFNPDFGYVDTAVPALAGLIIGTVALMGVPVATAQAREKKILRRYRATPLSPVTYLAADIAVNVGVGLLGMIILIVVGDILHDLRFAGNWLNVLAGFILSALAFCAMGYLIASLAPTARIAQAVGPFIFFPMLFLSGATMPREVMPEAMRLVSDLVPLTYVVKLIQGQWFGYPWGYYLVETLILAGMLGVGTLISSRVFRWE